MTNEELKQTLGDDLCDYCPWKQGKIAWNAIAMLHFKMKEYAQREDNGIDFLDEPNVSCKGKPQKPAL